MLRCLHLKLLHLIQVANYVAVAYRKKFLTFKGEQAQHGNYVKWTASMHTIYQKWKLIGMS